MLCSACSSPFRDTHQRVECHMGEPTRDTTFINDYLQYTGRISGNFWLPKGYWIRAHGDYKAGRGAFKTHTMTTSTMATRNQLGY